MLMKEGYDDPLSLTIHNEAPQMNSILTLNVHINQVCGQFCIFWFITDDDIHPFILQWVTTKKTFYTTKKVGLPKNNFYVVIHVVKYEQTWENELAREQ